MILLYQISKQMSRLGGEEERQKTETEKEVPAQITLQYALWIIYSIDDILL